VVLVSQPAAMPGQYWTTPFSDSARFYDAIYLGERDYSQQANHLAVLLRRLNPSAQTLLDVACGTGLHIEQLRHRFHCEGLDREEAMLRIARLRNPGVHFHLGDMRTFHTGRQYDALTCMFSSSSYAGNVDGVVRSLRCFARHLVPGGACVVEPFIPRESWVDQLTGHVRYAEGTELTVAAVDRAVRTGTTVVREIAYSAATPTGLEQLRERHVFGLYSSREYLSAFRDAGFEVEHDPQGFDATRGLYLARRLPKPDDSRD
jgi:predicted TPR repeat methyltransferase